MSKYPHLEDNVIDPRINGRRLKVSFMAGFIDMPEWTIERICDEYNLTPSQVYMSFAYYCDHKDQIDAIRQEDNKAYERIANDPDHKDAIAALKSKKGL